MLFDFIYGMHPERYNSQQRTWRGITAGMFTRRILFIHAEGLDVALDTQTFEVRFNAGNADVLRNLADECLIAAA
jgi:hypothetical protein